METTLVSPGGPGSSQRPHKREAGGSESEMEEAALMAVKTEEGATSQGCGTSRSWKRPEKILPWTFRKDRPCLHVGLAL